MKGEFTFKSKKGTISFREKLRKLVKRGKISKARWLLSNRTERFGESRWNPGYGVLPVFKFD
jgi:hypothetical protein